MDSLSEDNARVAYGFHAGTFDLRAICPQRCIEIDDGRAQAVRLSHRWEELLGGLCGLGLVLACAASGPISLTEAWLHPSFLPIPDSDVFVELETGCEIRCSAINATLASVENVGSQQIASLQFLDSTGQSVLKIVLTGGSDLTTFEELVQKHALSPVRAGRQAASSVAELVVPARVPDTASVRRLWAGLSRTMPTSHFPGLTGISRHAALSVVGTDLAWPVPAEAVREVLKQATFRRLAMGGAVRNRAVVLPSAFRPAQWQACGCGHTFFSDLGQFTLLAPDSAWEAWALRHPTSSGDAVCLEFYNPENRFCGGLGLHPETNAADRAWWNALLSQESLRERV